MLDTKPTSKILEQAMLRAATFESIEPRIDFGDGMTTDDFIALTQSTQSALREYNAAVDVINQNAQSIQDMEKRLAEMGDRMVMGIACKHGTQSQEYRMLEKIRRKAKPRVRSVEAKPTEVPAVQN
jgi:hypothetical protein